MFLRTSNNSLLFVNDTDGNYTELFNVSDYDAQYDQEVMNWIEWLFSWFI